MLQLRWILPLYDICLVKIIIHAKGTVNLSQLGHLVFDVRDFLHDVV